MKILISGAGIGGNALAFWLAKLSHDVTVVERFPNLRTTGLQVDLRGHGIEVLRRMGLEQAFRAKSAPEQGLQVVDSAGRQRAYFPANKSGKGLQGFTTEFEIMRGNLCRLFYDAAIEKKAKYIFGTSIESFEQKDGRAVEVRFADGKTDQFDLVVGADGQGSRTRKMMLGPDTADAFYPMSSLYAGYFTIPWPIQEGEQYIATSYMAPGRRSVVTRRQSPHDLQAYLICKSDSERLKRVRQGDVKEEKEALAEVFQDAGWKTEEILKALQDADDFYCERLGLVKLEPWSRGRVTLVGDAAYCPSAFTGMGTTSAVVGAYILAGEIGRHCRLPDRAEDAERNRVDIEDGLVVALEAYEQTFRPFMTQVQRGLSEDSGNILPSTTLGVAILNCLMGVASFLKLNLFGEWFLRENIKGWTLPEYKELVTELSL